MNPKISIGLVTRQILKPMVNHKRDIFEVLIETLDDQTMQDFELIIVDHFFKDRQQMFEGKQLAYPFRYCPPKPSPWDRLGAYKIANDRNSALILSRGELIILLDDCTVLPNPYLLRQTWNYYQKWVLLKPMLDGKNYAKGELNIQHDPLKEWVKTQRDTENFVFMDGVRALESSGHRGGVFPFPTWVWEELNGFDEMMNGDYPCEDVDLTDRVDAYRIFRYLLEKGQHPFVRIHHGGFVRGPGAPSKHMCNIAYHRWKHNQLQGSRREEFIAANRRELTGEDLEGISAICQECTGTCKERVPPNLEFYSTMRTELDLREARQRMNEKLGNRTGAFNPWD